MTRTKLTFTHGKRSEVYFPDPTQVGKIFEILDSHSLSQTISTLELCDIEMAVKNHFQIQSIKVRSRKKTIVYARHIFSYLAYMYSSKPLFVIGKFLNGKDHTTVIHSRKKIMQWLSVKDERLLADIYEIRKILSKYDDSDIKFHPTMDALQLMQIKGLT